MRIKSLKQVLAPIAVCSLGAAGGLAHAQPGAGSILEHYASLFSGADEYYFYADDRKQVIDYRNARVVRICAGKSRHLVPLQVTADGRQIEVAEGDCLRVEAEQIFLEPAEKLEPNTVLIANVETLAGS